jgi:hypothetical protein
MILLQQNKNSVVKKDESRGPLMILLSRDIENIPLRQMLTTLFTSFGVVSLMTFFLPFLVLAFIWKSDDVGGKSLSETSKSVHGQCVGENSTGVKSTVISDTHQCEHI